MVAPAVCTLSTSILPGVEADWESKFSQVLQAVAHNPMVASLMTQYSTRVLDSYDLGSPWAVLGCV